MRERMPMVADCGAKAFIADSRFRGRLGDDTIWWAGGTCATFILVVLLLRWVGLMKRQLLSPKRLRRGTRRRLPRTAYAKLSQLRRTSLDFPLSPSQVVLACRQSLSVAWKNVSSVANDMHSNAPAPSSVARGVGSFLSRTGVWFLAAPCDAMLVQSERNCAAPIISPLLRSGA